MIKVESFQRILKIDGAHNVRDLGGYKTRDGETQWGRVFRSDSLHAITDQSVESLLNMGLKTVIDLRHPDEVVEEPNRLQQHGEILYHNVSLFSQIHPGLDQKFKENLLLEIYLDTLKDRANAFKNILQLIAEAPEGGVLFHCSAGKDRTGMTAALLLSIADVEMENILQDYEITATVIQPRLEQIIETAKQKGINLDVLRSLMGSERKTLDTALKYLSQNYGSPVEYMLQSGLSIENVEALKRRMLD